MNFTHTNLAPEALAYPNGGQTRPGRAIYPDGKVRKVMGGIPDTFFTIPAHGRMNGKYVAGFLHVVAEVSDDLKCDKAIKSEIHFVINKGPHETQQHR